MSDAATVACEVINLGHRLAGREPFAPKGGARYHFTGRLESGPLAIRRVRL